MPRIPAVWARPIAPGWTIKKGEQVWNVVEQIRVSPVPKLGGWIGKQLRFLSVSRGQSVITDLEQGSLAVNRRSMGLPSMQRMWFHPQGFSLGYTKPRASPEPAELFFVGPDAGLWARKRLPATAIEARAGTDQSFVACRDGRVHAFTLDGSPLWTQLVPCARRDNATNEFLGLPIFHPRLHVTANNGMVAIGAEHEFHRYDPSGERCWSKVLPAAETSDRCTIPIDLPTRAQRLGIPRILNNEKQDRMRTGYLRLKLDTLLNAGWLKQVQVSDFEDTEEAEGPSSNIGVQVALGFPFQSGINILRATWNAIVIGSQDGFVHIFDRDGALQRTFRVGEAAVSDILVSGGALKAAYCAGRLTLFDGLQMTATAELPEYFTELTSCGTGVLAWKQRSIWLMDRSGRVEFAAEADRPIRGVWGSSTGFYVLSGELTAFSSARSAVEP